MPAELPGVHQKLDEVLCIVWWGVRFRCVASVDVNLISPCLQASRCLAQLKLHAYTNNGVMMIWWDVAWCVLQGHRSQVALEESSERTDRGPVCQLAKLSLRNYWVIDNSWHACKLLPAAIYRLRLCNVKLSVDITIQQRWAFASMDSLIAQRSYIRFT